MHVKDLKKSEVGDLEPSILEALQSIMLIKLKKVNEELK